MEFELHDDFIIEDIGICDIDVYDIEVEDTHNFFGNDILVHNSSFIDLNDLVLKSKLTDPAKITEFLDKFAKEKLGPIVKQACEDLSDQLNFYQRQISFKREKIAESIVFSGKKRNITKLWDKEGTRYKEPKLSVTGLESLKSSTPKPARAALDKAWELIMNADNDAVLNYIDEVKTEYSKLPPEDIAIPKSANGLSKFGNQKTIYSSGTPIHVRGTLLHNHYLKELGISGKYKDIMDGEKVKYLYLKMPNPIKENVISFTQVLPKELDLHKYVDYNTMFEKGFLDPLLLVLEAIKWRKNNNASLDDFF